MTANLRNSDSIAQRAHYTIGLLGQGKTRHQICTELAEKYDVPQRSAKRTISLARAMLRQELGTTPEAHRSYIVTRLLHEIDCTQPGSTERFRGLELLIRTLGLDKQSVDVDLFGAQLRERSTNLSVQEFLGTDGVEDRLREIATGAQELCES